MRQKNKIKNWAYWNRIHMSICRCFFDRTNTTLAALARCTHLQKRIAARMINLFRILFQSVFPYVNSRKNCLGHLWRCGSEHLPMFSLRVFPYSCMFAHVFLPALANTGTAPATDAASRHWAIKSSLPFCQRLNIIRAYMLARLECWGLSTNEEKKQEYQIVTRIQTIIHRLGRTQDMVKIGNIHLMKNVVLMEQILS